MEGIKMVFDSPSKNENEKMLSSPIISKKIFSEGIEFCSSMPHAWEKRNPLLFEKSSNLAAFLFQLEDEGFATVNRDKLSITWTNIFRIKESSDYNTSIDILDLPQESSWKPSLVSYGTLTDQFFKINISGWRNADGKSPKGNVVLEGPLLKINGKFELLKKEVWEAVQAVALFRKEKELIKDDYVEHNRKSWANIRSKAIASKVNLSDFLMKTIVISPDKIKLNFRKSDIASSVEVIPNFKGQPNRWIEVFDRFNEVKNIYEVPDGDGLTHILISQEVKSVLTEIKRMPGRRISGERAVAFLRNPFAVLGPDASSVLDPDQFEEARDEAGITFSRFSADIRKGDNGFPIELAILIEERVDGSIKSERIKFDSPYKLTLFLEKIQQGIEVGSQCCHWEGFDLEILGDTPDQVMILREALNEIMLSQVVTASDILNLEHYSDRIEGFGIENPYYSQYIPRKSSDEGWFPEDLKLEIQFRPEESDEDIEIVMNMERFDELQEKIKEAKLEDRKYFEFPGIFKKVSLEEAERISSLFFVKLKDSKKVSGDEKVKGGDVKKDRKGLIVKPNVNALDYEERRGDLLLHQDIAVSIPSAILDGVVLKDHQVKGLTWLRHLWLKSPRDCRGAILADDMGLGKTLQLLSFLASLREENQEIDPFLVVAPVSLLENWMEEIKKFFKPETFKVLMLYGDTLSAKRQPKELIDKDLLKDGIAKFLRQNWLDDSNLVLTTYETLRDLEFSLAYEKWSVVICDEAQKIKNPNALVTRAAKKQNAQFKIACTGTPVENSLIDIWCLFDFIQPGHLSSLKDFGQYYRHPIETKSGEDTIRLEQLRRIIDPQILRRTKKEVAKDLPKKIEVSDCRALQISARQRYLYTQAIKLFKEKVSTGESLGHLGLLQRLRRICSDPRELGEVLIDTTSTHELERDSPKMKWMLNTLESIHQRGEKAIIFCEFKDLQRTIQRAIIQKFNFTPDIINGDTSPSATSDNSRQKRIWYFQEKKGFGVIILSPLAVGFGVNIQAANHVIHFTRTWNPAKEDQATDRAYRIGQTRDVYVYYPVVVADDFVTFDAKLHELLIWKRELSTDMLNGVGDIKPSDFKDLDAPDGTMAFGDGVITPSDIEKFTPEAFEVFCKILWTKMGFDYTILTPRNGDGGIDVVAISDKKGVLIQCKSSSLERIITPNPFFS